MPIMPDNKRAHTRHPTQLNAVITSGDMLPRPCHIRDYCEGGMAISLIAPFPKTNPYPLNSSVIIHFAVALETQDLEYQIQAQITHIFEGGLGISYLTPDLQAIHSINQLVADTQISDATSPPSPSALSGKIRSGLQELTLVQFKNIISAFLKQTENDFFSIAEQSENDNKQNIYFDALSDFKKIQKNIAARLLNEFKINLGNTRRLASVPGQKNQKDNLKLIGKQAFEGWLVVSEVTARVESTFRQPLDHLNDQLSQIYHQDINDGNNPLGPALIFVCARETFVELLLPLDISIIANSTFKKY